MPNSWTSKDIYTEHLSFGFEKVTHLEDSFSDIYQFFYLWFVPVAFPWECVSPDFPTHAEHSNMTGLYKTRAALNTEIPSAD